MPSTKLLGVIVALVVGGFILGAWFFYESREEVVIDNTGTIEVSVFVDGTKVASILPNTLETKPKSIHVTRGKHTLGYVKGSGDTPAETTSVEVTDAPVHLYNPGKSSCYWVYGGASGPRHVEDYYELPSIDGWFSPSTGISLQRNPPCIALGEKHCPVSIRNELVDCQARATTSPESSACVDKARDDCAFRAR
jgi:hypothetical protein